MTTDDVSRQWPYQRVAATLRDKIASGALAGQIPSVMTLADELDVAHGTVERAVRMLKSEGLLESVPGLGTFVRKPG